MPSICCGCLHTCPYGKWFADGINCARAAKSAGPWHQPQPQQPEDHDGYADGDGCPDLDDDADGVPDAIASTTLVAPFDDLAAVDALFAAE